MVLQERLIHNALRHRHVYIHGGLHSGLLLQSHKLVLVDALLRPALGVILIRCRLSVLVFFKEGHCEVYVGLWAAGDHLRPFVAIVVRFGLVGGEGRRELAVLGHFPVDALEDGMFPDLVECGAKARVLHEDGLEEAAHQPGHARSVPGLALDDVVIDLLRVLVEEGGATRDDLAYEHPKRPDVGFEAGSDSPQYLRCDVVRRSAIGVRSHLVLGLVVPCEAFSETEIHKLAVALTVDHDMLWLQIPIHYQVRM